MTARDPGTIDAVVGFLWRYFWLVLAMALTFAGLAMVVILFLATPRYEASTTLLVTPPTYSSTLKSPALSVQGYQKLLESDAVLVDAKQVLLEKGLLKPEFSMRVGESLNTRIFVARRSEERVLAPIIEASVEAESPELAAAIANTWAEVFLTHNRKLVSTGTMSTVQFIEGQFTASRESLEAVEQEKVEVANDYQQKIDEVTIRWLDRLVAFERETESRVATFQAVTRRIIEELVEVSTREEPSDVLDPIRPSLYRVALLRTQMAQTPPVIELEKAITNDALWQATMMYPERLSEVQNRTLSSEVVNSAHSELVVELSRIETGLQDVPLASLKLLREIGGDLEDTQQKRSAGRANLVAQRALEREAMERRRQQEEEALRRERDLRIARLEREVEHNREMFSELAGKYEQAELARAEQDLADIRLGSRAVPPLRPEPSRVLLKALLAAVFGACLGLAIALSLHRRPAPRTQALQ